jgi:hypothetical protein
MAHWDDSSGTSYTTYTSRVSSITDVYYGRSKKEPSKLEYSSEPLGEIASAGIIAGNVSIFAHRGSPVFKDTNTLNHIGISPYYSDPVVLGYDTPTRLFSYNFSIVIDALEYIQGKMAKANLIKEALATLKHGSNNPFVIILTKTRKMVEELAKNNGYEEAENGFLITDGPFRGLVVQGLDVEDLLNIAHFAGAKHAVEDTLVKTDLTCIKIHLYEQE